MFIISSTNLKLTLKSTWKSITTYVYAKSTLKSTNEYKSVKRSFSTRSLTCLLSAQPASRLWSWLVGRSSGCYVTWPPSQRRSWLESRLGSWRKWNRLPCHGLFRIGAEVDSKVDLRVHQLMSLTKNVLTNSIEGIWFNQTNIDFIIA